MEDWYEAHVEIAHQQGQFRVVILQQSGPLAQLTQVLTTGDLLPHHTVVDLLDVMALDPVVVEQVPQDAHELLRVVVRR